MDFKHIEACLRDELAQATEFARRGRAHVARQRQIVGDLARDGHDTAVAVALLKTLEETQALHEESGRPLDAELAAFQIEHALVAQSRSELRRRVQDLKGTHTVLESGVKAVDSSRSLLDRVPEKP
jgi:ribosomal 50S subunit-associated protein YjgA (DUF615 family)